MVVRKTGKMAEGVREMGLVHHGAETGSWSQSKGPICSASGDASRENQHSHVMGKR